MTKQRTAGGWIYVGSLLVLLSSCESLWEKPLPYAEDQLVVYGTLQADSVAVAQVYRTQAPNGIVQDTGLCISDAVVTLLLDDSIAEELTWQPDCACYRGTQTLSPGQFYRLRVQRADFAYALSVALEIPASSTVINFKRKACRALQSSPQVDLRCFSLRNFPDDALPDQWRLEFFPFRADTLVRRGFFYDIPGLDYLGTGGAGPICKMYGGLSLILASECALVDEIEIGLTRETRRLAENGALDLRPTDSVAVCMFAVNGPLLEAEAYEIYGLPERPFLTPGAYPDNIEGGEGFVLAISRPYCVWVSLE